MERIRCNEKWEMECSCWAYWLEFLFYIFCNNIITGLQDTAAASLNWIWYSKYPINSTTVAISSFLRSFSGSHCNKAELNQSSRSSSLAIYWAPEKSLEFFGSACSRLSLTLSLDSLMSTASIVLQSNIPLESFLWVCFSVFWQYCRLPIFSKAISQKKSENTEED